MLLKEFEQSFDRIIGHEGGFQNCQVIEETGQAARLASDRKRVQSLAFLQ